MPIVPRLFRATDLAAFCQVDLKTIHNWASNGKIEHFRTPGRHLRFKAADVAAFLLRYGYDMPASVAEAQAQHAAA